MAHTGISVIALATVTMTLHAQRPTPGDGPNAKIPIRVFVSLSDSATRYYPVRSHQLIFYRTISDSVLAFTDSTGAANVALVPGEYRLVSAHSVVWHGYAYSWNVPVTIRRGMTTIDLRGPEADRGEPTLVVPNATVPRASDPQPVLAGVAQPQTTVSRPDNAARHGAWFYVGLGAGSLGCQDCVDRANGFSGGLGIGGTINPHVQLGAMTAGWARSEQGITLTAGVVVAAARIYPSATSGFFILAGLGLGSVDVTASGLGEANSTGSGALLGLGWDVPLGAAVHLTPFWNGAGISYSGGDANFGQIGLGLTIH
jgi:hypothetical protein